MNARTGRLSQRELQTVDRAWEILSDWATMMDKREEAKGGDALDLFENPLYNDACNAIAGLCEFLASYRQSDR